MKAEHSRPLELTEQEALALLSMCLMSPAEYDAVAYLAVARLAKFCKTRLTATEHERQQLLANLNESLIELEKSAFRSEEALQEVAAKMMFPVLWLNLKGTILWQNPASVKRITEQSTTIYDAAHAEDRDLVSEVFTEGRHPASIVFRAAHGQHFWHLLRTSQPIQVAGEDRLIAILYDITGMIEATDSSISWD